MFIFAGDHADGPWVEPPAYLRAFTECYVLGCVLLAFAPVHRRSDWVIAGAAEITFVSLQWCLGTVS